MSWRKFLILALCVFAVSCGKKEENGVPAPDNPSDQPGTPVPEPTDNTDTRFPDYIKVATPMRGWSTLPGLLEIFGIPYTDIVGNPLISIKSSVSGTDISGELLLVIEEKEFADFIQVPSFMGYWNGSTLDIIYADDLGVFRLTGSKSGEQLSGTLTTRTRQAGENQCKLKTICQKYYEWVNGVWVERRNCQPDPNVYAECGPYMDSANANVKQVSTYIKTKVSEWIQ